MAKMGRPLKEIDWADVDKLCALQCLETEIAGFLSISVDTLNRACQREHGITFAEYFSQKRGAGKIALRRSQWQAAQKGNPTMLIWLGKQHLGQQDKQSHEFSGPGGGPIETKDVSSMPKEELDARIQALLEKRQGVSK